MKLKPYEFEAETWPPPKDEEQRGTYLFGFDDDYTPYVLRFETTPGFKGWCATTLEDSMTGSRSSADPVYLNRSEVSRKIKWWAKTPVAKYIEKRYG